MENRPSPAPRKWGQGRDELALSISGNLQALDLARRGQQVALVVSIALSPPGGGELALASLEVLGHLLFEHLLKDGLHALAPSGLHVKLHVVLELMLFRGQVSPSSLNPQPTRHYLEARAPSSNAHDALTQSLQEIPQMGDTPRRYWCQYAPASH